MCVIHRIITWNAQGGGVGDEAKKQILEDEVQKSVQEIEREPIIILQEAGYREVENTVGKFEKDETYLHGIKYCMYQLLPYRYSSYEERHEDVNYRCTIQTLVPQDLNEVTSEPFHMDSGYDNRPLLVIDIDGFRIANFHAPSGKPYFAKSCINKSISNLNLGSLPWILGGDMNYHATDFSKMLPAFKNWRMEIPTAPTHGDDMIYDYFFCHNSVPKCNVWTEVVSESDHEMVIMDILM